ncbi:MAG: InlB B-repeat-containing protein, partial [Anaeroplasmataceae bacterium]|nr:InlB B-repeat-containing protein [Anaeroplasmataceae bacterium]
EYTISFKMDDDPNAINPNGNILTYTIEDRITLLKATSPGYSDSVWKIEDTNITLSEWEPYTRYGNFNVKVEWVGPREYQIQFNYNGGTGSKIRLIVEYGSTLESFAIPTKYDYEFLGFYSVKTGARYYDSYMKGTKWYQSNDDTFIANWQQVTFTITFEQQNGIGTGSVFTEVYRIDYGASWESIEMPTRKGYKVSGFYYKYKLDNRRIFNADGSYNYQNVVFGSTCDLKENITLFCYWEVENYYYFIIDGIHARSSEITMFDRFELEYDGAYSYSSAPETLKWVEYSIDGKNIISTDTRGFTCWRIKRDISGATSDWIDFSTNKTLEFTVAEIITKYYPNYDTVDNIYFRAVYSETVCNRDCVASGTQITLANGTQVPVESLTGNEQLLVWNMITGKFEAAPILFICKEECSWNRVINLTFADGTTVKVISEHGFWDITLNRYVYLDETASKYIGHWFNKQGTDENGNMIWTQVQLVDVCIIDEYTSAYSPVTYGYLCYYVNGMLSMPGGIEGLFNIFDVNPETMTYDIDAMTHDIETYGLFSYEEFSEIVDIPQEMFDAVNGQYLK